MSWVFQSSLIQRKLNELREWELKQAYQKNIITLESIKKFFHKTGDKNLFSDYAENYVKAIRGKSLNTIKVYNTFLKHINKFHPNLAFNQLSEALFQNFAHWLATEKNLLGSSVHKYFKPFRIIAREAVKEGYLEKDPFFAVSIASTVKKSKPNRTYLEIEDITRLKNLTTLKS